MSRDDGGGCVALPYGAMDLSAVCDCGIPDHTHLLFFGTNRPSVIINARHAWLEVITCNPL